MRKKRILRPVLAVLLTVGAYLFSISDMGTGTGHEGGEWKAVKPPEQLEMVEAQGLSPNKYIEAMCTKATDGDTFDIQYKTKEYKVRMLDVDTPESVKRGVEVQEYANEASDFTKKLLEDQKVKLVFEKGVRDRYGRLLAHVFLQDGTYVNGLLVRNGYARIEFVSPNTRYKEYFQQLQQQAIQDKLGVWELPVSRQPFVKDKNGEYKPRYWVQKQAG